MKSEMSRSKVLISSPVGLRREMLWLSTGAAVIVAGLVLAGRLAPWITPDTPGYFDLGSFPGVFAQPRNPLYGWTVSLLPGSYSAVPPIQIGLYFLAVILLHRAARIYGLSAKAATSFSVSLLVSNVVLLWSNAVHPEFPAVTFAILSITQVFLLAAGPILVRHIILLSLSLGTAYIFRPIFLPAMILFPILYLLLLRLRGIKATRYSFLGLLLACSFPFLAMSSLRLATVKDFNIVSFGGFAMSGMAGLMLSDEVISRMPAETQLLAKQILERRTRAEELGNVIQTPRNSMGKRSFVSAALGYFDIYARTYDNLLYQYIAKLKGDEDWISWNQRLMRLSISTVLAAPDRYLAWLVGGTSRSVGRLLVTNLPFMLGLIGLTGIYIYIFWRDPRRAKLTVSNAIDIPAIVFVTMIYTVASGALSVFVTMPAARYLDSAGLFLPSLPIYFALCLLGSGVRNQPDLVPKNIRQG